MNTFWNYLLLNMTVWWDYQGGDKADARGTDKQPLPDKMWYDGTMWRNLQCLTVVIQMHRPTFCVKEMKEKSVTFCFLKSKGKTRFSKTFCEEF